MSKTPSHYPLPGEFDPFDDPLDDVEEWDGFIILSEDLDERDSTCYRGMDDHPFCDFDMGDKDGFCVKDRWGCHYIGCEFSED